MRDQAETALQFVNFGLAIGSKRILHGVNAAIEKNRITAIIGPSGTGKSVLLRAIVGLLETSVSERLRYKGKILVEGKDVLTTRHQGGLDLLRKRAVYVGQNPVAFPMSIYENVAFGVRYWNPELSQGELETRVQASLEATGLWSSVRNRLRSDPRDLSGGQLQMLCIARALAIEPLILLLDEPSAYIDPVSTGTLEASFVKLKERTTLFIVTHNLQQASRISDQTLFLNAMEVDGDLVGTVVEDQATDRLFINPEKKSTEEYITGRFG